MKIISMDRQSGKTTEMLNHLKYDPRTILLVSSESQAHSIRAELVRKGSMTNSEAHNRVFSTRGANLTSKLKGLPQDSVIVIDELDSVLYSLIGLPVKTATITER